MPERVSPKRFRATVEYDGTEFAGFQVNPGKRTVQGVLEDALARLDADPEGFDLVLSDWDRPEALDGSASAGLKLLRALAAHPRRLPVIFYHGEFDEARRATRRDTLLRAGAFGEAVSPGELLALVRTALQSA